jgi:hypothetical protein
MIISLGWQSMGGYGLMWFAHFHCGRGESARSLQLWLLGFFLEIRIFDRDPTS